MEEPPKENFLYGAVLPKVECIAWPLALLGLGLLYAGHPAGPIALMVGLGTLAQLFFLRSFQPLPISNELEENLVYIPVMLPSDASLFLTEVIPKLQGIAGAVTLIGVLFKLLFWKGSAVLLIVSVPTLLLVVACQAAAGKLPWRTSIVTALGLAAWLTPTETVVQQLYHDDPALVAKILYQHQHQHPRDQAAAQEAQELLRARHQRLRGH